MKQHGIYKNETIESEKEIYEAFWMGERVTFEDFNERLMAQFKSAAKDLDWMLKGAELTDKLNEGEKTTAKLDQVEEILKLPLCAHCKALIGAV